MRLTNLLVLVLVIGACEKRNPERCSDNNHCPDPALPFCDVDGAIGGEPRECIAVSCTVNELEACRGEREVRCNATGDNFDVVQCELGCDAALGCRLCEPNQTRCTNGRVGTCDSNGNIISMESCALGCFLDEPRCRVIDPSNGLAAALDFGGNDTIDLNGGYIMSESGEVRDQSGTPISITTSLKTSTNGPAIRVFVARNIRLKDVAIFRNQLDHDIGGAVTDGPAIAFLATETITVEGRVRVHHGAGGVSAGGCVGEANYSETEEGRNRATGGGGGGHGTQGANGGALTPLYPGGVGGEVSGTENLIPLRGGCSGGGAYTEGGGAIQLSSGKTITIKGVIDVRGETAEQTAGGGAGGGILIEAPVVKLESEARLIATGGGGGAGFGEGIATTPTDDGTPQPGYRCSMPSSYCGAGGNGAAPGVPATKGADAPYATNVEATRAGGGGGGLGRIRINTPDRTYTKSSMAVEAGVLSTGILSTR